MWTKEQAQAIEAPVTDILVTAAAGSGKTAVMVERIIQRIMAEDGTDIDRMLVVTFTKAAASEIKGRIADKISEKLAESDSPRLKRQLALINRAAICTIHGFCLDTIKDNFHLLGLSPDFKVGDTADLAMLENKAISDVLDKHYEEEDKTFLRLINSLTKRRDDDIEDIVKSIYKFSLSTADPKGYLDECCRIYTGECDNQLGFMLQKVKIDASYAAHCYKRAMRLCLLDKSFEKVMEVIGEEMNLARNIYRRCDEGWDSVYECTLDYKFSTMRPNKNMDPDLWEDIKLLRKKGRDTLKSIMVNKVNLSVEVIKKDLEYMSPCVEKLCQLVEEFSKTFTNYKRENNLVDFNDIEHLALNLFTNPLFSEVAESQRERFEEIYVDEYQDCNGVQEALFKAVSREPDGCPNIFMVGDMKQCIYRFRNANPMLFKHKSDTYTPYGEGSAYNKIILSKNFRSRPEVLDFVNLVFSRVMSQSVGELDYSDDEKLYAGAAYEDLNDDTRYIDLCIVDASDDTDSEESSEKPANLIAEAELVSRKIRSLVDSGYKVYDKSAGGYRPVMYRDIAILLRGTKNSGEYFADSLADHGIPAFCDTGIGYFDCEEVRLLISFMKIISNPYDDINIVSVMRSPVYNFTDRELLKIRTADRRGAYYDALAKYSEKADILSKKVKSFLNKISDYRERSKIMAADEFLWYLVSDTNYMEFIGTLPGASFKKSNIRALINRATGYAINNGGDISAFAGYVDAINMGGNEGQGAKLIGENDDVVRIMTIHKSKGLEFPVVFLSQCGKKFNTRDLSGKVLMHHELGLGIDYVDEKKRFSYVPTVKNAIKEKILEENLSEEMRLLYVALTRAREKLFITGVVDNYVKFMADIRQECEGAEDKIHQKSVSMARTYLKWVCQALYEDGGNAIRHLPVCGFVRREVVPIYTLGVQWESDSESEIQIPKKSAHSEYKGEILSRLTYEYPYKNDTEIPRNITVTEIKRINETDDDSYRIYRMPTLKQPGFISGEAQLDAARIGTVMHLCMQKIELTSLADGYTIEGEIERLTKDGIITDKEAACVDIGAIKKFFGSTPGKEMLVSDNVCREAPFEILVEANEIFPRAQTDEKIVVQGMIDAYFTDKDGNLILVDYKTDRRGKLTEAEFEERIRGRYRMQLEYYEKALELLTGRRVYKKYIYLFDTGRAVEM
ncbi:MAG: helicase-exonuclease AddAB subunit AddA [Ruminococcaceae bacterium]|nr:helicase-exonuclease AddAB subunit AddA [Oscillospiraceae bacterium]